jgi:hypothetical protein
MAPASLPMVTYSEMENGTLTANHCGVLEPFTSKTAVFEGHRPAEMARFFQLSFLVLQSRCVIGCGVS